MVFRSPLWSRLRWGALGQVSLLKYPFDLPYQLLKYPFDLPYQLNNSTVGIEGLW